MASSEFWRSLHREFEVLAEREDKLLDGRSSSDLILRAYCSYGLEHPPTGHIRITRGATSEIRLKYDDIATRAGRALNCPENVRLRDFWVHSLCHYLIGTDRTELIGRPQSGCGIIQGLIRSSAAFSLVLAMEAEETEHRAGGAAAVVNSASSAPAAYLKLRFTKEQLTEMGDAEKELDQSFVARERLRALLHPTGERRIAPSPHDPSLAEDFRTLERDIVTYGLRVIRTVADAATKADDVEHVTECLSDCVRDLKARILAKIDRRDVRQFDVVKFQSRLQTELDPVIARLRKEAPAPWLNVDVEGEPYATDSMVGNRPEFWRELRSEFEALIEKQKAAMANRDKWLHALFISSQPGDMERCEIHSRGQADGRFISDVKDLVTRAGFGLGAPQGVDPVKYWIYRLALNIKDAREPEIRKEFKLSNASEGHGWLPDFLGSSAGYCSRLSAGAATEQSLTPLFSSSRQLETGDKAAIAAPSQKAPETPEAKQKRIVQESAARRQVVVMPILKRKGWSRNKWASKAGVGKNSVYDYLNGERALSPENRKAMAEALDLEPDALAD